MEATAEVATLADYETEITFPRGPVGILLEPVVRVGNRKVGARVAGFSPSGDQDFFVKGRTSSPFPLSPSASFGDLAVEHLRIGNVLTCLDDVCTKNMSFDRIMSLLHEKSNQTRKLRFKDVEAAWFNSLNRGSPSLENKLEAKVAVSPFTAYSQLEESRSMLSPPRIAENGYHLSVSEDSQHHDEGGGSAVLTQPRPVNPSTASATARTTRREQPYVRPLPTLADKSSPASLAAAAYASSLNLEALEEVEEEEEEGDVSLVPCVGDDDSTCSLDALTSAEGVTGASIDPTVTSEALPRTPRSAPAQQRTTTASSPAIVSLEAFLASPADANPFEKAGQENSVRLSLGSQPSPSRGDGASLLLSEKGATPPASPQTARWAPPWATEPPGDSCPRSDGSMKSVDLDRPTVAAATTSPQDQQRLPLQEILQVQPSDVSRGFHVRRCAVNATEASTESSIAEDGTTTAYDVAVGDASFEQSIALSQFAEPSLGGGGGSKGELSKAAALEEMVANLLEQKVGWAERTASVEAELKAGTARAGRLEQDLAAKDDTLDFMSTQLERDADTIRTLQQKVHSLELSIGSVGDRDDAGNEEASSGLTQELVALRRTVVEQSKALDRAHAAAATWEALEDRTVALQAELARAKADASLESQRGLAALSAAQRLGKREAEVATSLRRQLEKAGTLREEAEADIAELRDKLKILMQGALATATSIAGNRSSAPSLGGYTPFLASPSGVLPPLRPSSAPSAAPEEDSAPSAAAYSSSSTKSAEHFDKNAYLQGLVVEAEAEEEQAHQKHQNPQGSVDSDDEERFDVSTGDEPEPTATHSYIEGGLPAPPDSSALTALQEVVSKLMEEKLEWLDQREQLHREAGEQEVAIEELASTARSDDGALEEANSELDRLRIALSDSELRVSESEANLSLALRRAEAASVTRAEAQAFEHSKALANLRCELEGRVSELEQELTEMRSAVLEMTQEDGAEEEEQRAEFPSSHAGVEEESGEEKAPCPSTAPSPVVPTVNAAEFLLGENSPPQKSATPGQSSSKPCLFSPAASTPEKPLLPTPRTAAVLQLCERIDANVVLPPWQSPAGSDLATPSKVAPTSLTRQQTTSAIRKFKQEQQLCSNTTLDELPSASVAANTTPVKGGHSVGPSPHKAAAIAAWRLRHASGGGPNVMFASPGAPLGTPQKGSAFPGQPQSAPSKSLFARTPTGGDGERYWRSESKAGFRRLAEARESLEGAAQRRDELAAQCVSSAREAESFARLRSEALNEVDKMKEQASASDARVVAMENELSSLRAMLQGRQLQEQEQISSGKENVSPTSQAAPAAAESLTPQAAEATTSCSSGPASGGVPCKSPQHATNTEGFGTSWPRGLVQEMTTASGEGRGASTKQEPIGGGENSWLELQGYPVHNQDASFVSLDEDAAAGGEDPNECSNISDITSSFADGRGREDVEKHSALTSRFAKKGRAAAPAALAPHSSSSERRRLEREVRRLRSHLHNARENLEGQRQAACEARAEARVSAQISARAHARRGVEDAEDKCRSHRLDERATRATEAAEAAAKAAQAVAEAAAAVTAQRTVVANANAAAAEVEAAKNAKEALEDNQSGAAAALEQARFEAAGLRGEVMALASGAEMAVKQRDTLRAELAQAREEASTAAQSVSEGSKDRALRIAAKKKQWLQEIRTARRRRNVAMEGAGKVDEIEAADEAESTAVPSEKSAGDKQDVGDGGIMLEEQGAQGPSQMSLRELAQTAKSKTMAAMLAAAQPPPPHVVMLHRSLALPTAQPPPPPEHQVVEETEVDEAGLEASFSYEAACTEVQGLKRLVEDAEATHLEALQDMSSVIDFEQHEESQGAEESVTEDKCSSSGCLMDASSASVPASVALRLATAEAGLDALRSELSAASLAKARAKAQLEAEAARFVAREEVLEAAVAKSSADVALAREEIKTVSATADKNMQAALDEERAALSTAFEERMRVAESHAFAAQRTVEEADAQVAHAESAAEVAAAKAESAEQRLGQELERAAREASASEASAADQRVALLDHAGALQEAVDELEAKLKKSETALVNAAEEGKGQLEEGQVMNLQRRMQEAVEEAASDRALLEARGKAMAGHLAELAKSLEASAQANREASGLLAQSQEETWRAQEAAAQAESQAQAAQEQVELLLTKLSVAETEEKQQQWLVQRESESAFTVATFRATEAEERVASLWVELEEARAFATKVKEVAATEKSSLQSWVCDLEQSIGSLTKQIEDATACASISKAEANAAIGILRQDLTAALEAKAGAEMALCETDAEAVRGSQKCAELEQRLKEGMDALAHEKGKRAEHAESSLLDLDTLRSELSSAVAAKAEAEEWLEDCRGKLAATEGELEARGAASAQYAAETLAQRANLVDEVRRLQAALGESEGRVAAAAVELGARAEAAGQALADATASRAALARAEALAAQEKAAHQEALARLEASAVAASQGKELEEEAASVRAAALYREKDECVGRLAAKDAQLKVLEAECEEGQRAYDAAVCRASAAEEALSKVEGDLEMEKLAFARGLVEAREYAEEATLKAVEEATKCLNSAEATAEACSIAAATATEEAWAAAEVAAQEMAEAAEAEAQTQAGRARLEYEETLEQLQCKLSEATQSAAMGEVAAASFAEERVGLAFKAEKLEEVVATLQAQLESAEVVSEERAETAFKTEAELASAIAELEEARAAVTLAENGAAEAETNRAQLSERVRELEAEVTELAQESRRGAKRAAEEQLEVAAAARALEKMASDARLSAAQEEVVSIQALLERSEDHERLIAQELGEREEELAVLKERCSEVEEELTGMEADLDSVAMRAAAAEAELELLVHKHEVEKGKRKQSDALAAERLVRAEDLQSALDDATEEGREREAKALAAKHRLNLELTATLARTAATVGVCAASAKVAEIRMGLVDEAQGDLSRLVRQAESAAVGSVGRLQQQLEELRGQVASRDGRVRNLRDSLRESQDATRKAEAGLARAVEQHALKQAGLEGALRGKQFEGAEAAHELSLLRATVHGGQPHDPLLLSPGYSQLPGVATTGADGGSAVLSLAGLTPGHASRARVAYLERLRADIAKLRADNQRLRLGTALSPQTLLLPLDGSAPQQQQQQSEAKACSSLQGDLAMEAPPPAARRSASSSHARSTSSTREASANLRAQNRTLHDHVQRSRRALLVINSAKAKLGAPKSSTATAPNTIAVASQSNPVVAGSVTAKDSVGDEPTPSMSTAPSASAAPLDVKLGAVVQAVRNAVDKENVRASANTVAVDLGSGKGSSEIPQRITPTRMQARLAEKRLSSSAKKQQHGNISTKAPMRSSLGGTSTQKGMKVWEDSTEVAASGLSTPRKGGRSLLRSFASPKLSAAKNHSAAPRSAQRTPLSTRRTSTGL